MLPESEESGVLCAASHSLCVSPSVLRFLRGKGFFVARLFKDVATIYLSSSSLEIFYTFLRVQAGRRSSSYSAVWKGDTLELVSLTSCSLNVQQ